MESNLELHNAEIIHTALSRNNKKHKNKYSVRNRNRNLPTEI